MVKQTKSLLCFYAPLALALAIGQPALAQVRFDGIQVNHTPYNDLITHVNRTATEVFASTQGRNTSAADLLKSIDQLIPMMDAELLHPPAAILAERTKVNPASVQQSQALYKEILQKYDLFRLALDDPKTVQAYQAAKDKGGKTAALAAVNRAAADWLNTGQDPTAQTAAFNDLRAALKASAQNVSWEFWYTLWTNNPAASEAVGTPLLAYLKQYPNTSTPEARRMLMYVGISVKHMQLDGKPLIIDGTQANGNYFSTAGWKGKVILIDGWHATTQPTVEFIPHIQSIYAKHHAEGLEVLGIGYEEKIDEFKAFLKPHPEFTFPKIFQAAKPNDDYGCLMEGQLRFGVDGLGAAMVVDRKGLLHYLSDPLDAAKVEADVAKLLAEKP